MEEEILPLACVNRFVENPIVFPVHHADALIGSSPPETLFGNMDRVHAGYLRQIVDGVNTRTRKNIQSSLDNMLDVAHLASSVGLGDWHLVSKCGKDSILRPFHSAVCQPRLRSGSGFARREPAPLDSLPRKHNLGLRYQILRSRRNSNRPELVKWTSLPERATGGSGFAFLREVMKI